MRETPTCCISRASIFTPSNALESRGDLEFSLAFGFTPFDHSHRLSLAPVSPDTSQATSRWCPASGATVRAASCPAAFAALPPADPVAALAVADAREAGQGDLQSLAV